MKSSNTVLVLIQNQKTASESISTLSCNSNINPSPPNSTPKHTQFTYTLQSTLSRLTQEQLEEMDIDPDDYMSDIVPMSKVTLNETTFRQKFFDQFSQEHPICSSCGVYPMDLEYINYTIDIGDPDFIPYCCLTCLYDHYESTTEKMFQFNSTAKILARYFTNNSCYKQAEVKSYYSDELAQHGRQQRAYLIQLLTHNDSCTKPEIPEMIENESEELLLSQNLLAVR